jgi:hypothetical protein
MQHSILSVPSILQWLKNQVCYSKHYGSADKRVITLLSEEQTETAAMKVDQAA